MATILLNVKVDQNDLKKAEQQIDKLFNGENSSGNNAGGTKGAKLNVDSLRKSYANLLTTIQSSEKYFKKGTFDSIQKSAKNFQAQLRSLNTTQTNYESERQRLQNGLNALQREFAETRQQSNNLHGSLLEIVKGFGKFQLAAMLIMKPLQFVRQAWEDLNETLVKTEDKLIEIQRVVGDSANAEALYKMAQRYGQTFENVSDITLNFARNGMDWAEALQATEAALLAINVAELDATQASEGMIAIMNQFGYEASELEGIVDKLNITADNAAVSTEKLLTALQRTGSSAKNANLNLEETVGIITALSEATGRSGENLGTAVNSLIQFSTKGSSLDTFAKLGGNVEAVVERYRAGGATVLEIWRALSEVIQSNAQYTESVLGKNFSTSDFESLNEELKSALGESFAETTEIYDTASTFRKNYFIALLNNLDQVQETIDEMNGAQGYSQKENEQYLDTYTAKVNTLKAKWQEIANDEQGLLVIKKYLIDVASNLLDIIQRLGGIKGVLQTVIAVASPFLIKWTLAFGVKTLTSAINGVATLFSAIKTGALSANAALGAIGIIAGVVTTIVNAVKASKEIDLADITSANSSVADIQQNLQNVTEEYKDLEEKINKYRSALEDNTSTEKEREEALKGLNEIQNSLKNDTNEYASSLDLVNGKLDDQIEKLHKLEFLERKKAVQEFVDKNIDAIYYAEQYLDENAGSIYFNEFMSDTDRKAILAGNEKALKNHPLAKFLLDQGESIRINGDFWDTIGSWFGDTLQVSVGEKGTREETIAYLEKLFDEAIKIDNKEERDYVQAKLREAINKIAKDETFVSSSNLIYGNAEGSTLFEKLSNEQREALLKTTSQGEWDNLLKEWGYISDGGNGGGTPETSVDIDSIVENLKAIRDNTEKTKELEEKQLALQEAQNQRTVRVFNAETGQWEMQANQKAIAQAKDNLQDTAMSNVINALENGQIPEDYEIPDWLQNILAPTSDEQFKTFLTSMGILAGVFDKTSTTQSGGVVSNTASTTNNNQSYSLNGIPIPVQDATKYFTPEALALLSQME